MFDHALTEEPLHFGEGGRLFGILTLPTAQPRSRPDVPVFVFLSAGLLHRVGPARLHVRLARELARMGFSSLRVDLAGIGDSPQRPGLTNQESVAADYEEIVRVLESRLGRLSIVMGGICAAADNAIRLTLTDQRVVGMLLLDPVCFADDGFTASAVIARYMQSESIHRVVEAPIQGGVDPDPRKVETNRWADIKGHSDSGAATSGVRGHPRARRTGPVRVYSIRAS